MKTKGFVLIELLIVIVIIGILASMAMQQYERMKIKSQDAEPMRILPVLADAVWLYYIETGGFPNSDPGPNGWIAKNFNTLLPKGKLNFSYFYLPSHNVPEPPYVRVSSRRNINNIGNVYVYQMLYTRDPNYRFLPYAPDVPLTAHPLDKGWYIYHVAVSSNPHPVHSPSDDLLVKDGW